MSNIGWKFRAKNKNELLTTRIIKLVELLVDFIFDTENREEQELKDT